MAKLALVRVDYRMVHGQVASSCVRSNNASIVYVMNDEAALDKTQAAIMKISVGATTKLKVVSVENGVNAWKEDKFGKGIAVVIFRTIEDAYKAYNLGFEYNSINIGQVPMADDRKHAVGTINLSEHEMDLLEELTNKGIEVYNHQTIHDNRFDWNDIKKSMGR